jgi:hypothetical protein
VNQGKTVIASGVVVSYDPVARFYDVRVDNWGQQRCLRTNSFGTKVHPKQTRVLVVRSENMQWVVLSAIDTPADKPEANPRDDQTPEELLKGSDAAPTPRFGDASDPTKGPLSDPQRDDYQVDEGDALVQADSRLRFGVLGTGSIIARVSALCFTFWDSLKDRLIERTRSVVRSAVGWAFEAGPNVQVNAQEDQTSTVRVRAGSVGRADIAAVIGRLSLADRRPATGQSAAAQVANKSGLFIDGLRALFSSGVVLDSDPASGELRLSKLNAAGKVAQQLRINNDEFTLLRIGSDGTEQTLSLTDAGFVIKAKSIGLAPLESLYLFSPEGAATVTALGGMPNTVGPEAARLSFIQELNQIQFTSELSAVDSKVLTELFATAVFNTHTHASPGGPTTAPVTPYTPQS